MEIRAPQAAGQLARQVVDFVQSVRRMELQKKPGIAETLDWTAALLRMGISVIDDDGAERILETLSALIKTRGDRAGFTRDVVARHCGRMLTDDQQPLAGELGRAVRARLAGFAGFLRANGFGVGGTDAVSAARSRRNTWGFLIRRCCAGA